MAYYGSIVVSDPSIVQFGVEGDGYQQKSPHTANEKFEGLHILDAAKVQNMSA